jgi:hypothetical protein
VQQTPLWVPLVVGGLGLLGTLLAGLGGVLITQRATVQREAASWQRQLEREREAWQRDDQVRTFDYRRQAYEDYFVALKAMDQDLHDAAKKQREPSEELFIHLFNKLQIVYIYGTEPVTEVASSAWENARKWQANPQPYDYADPEADPYRYYVSAAKLLQKIRDDLAVPGKPLG